MRKTKKNPYAGWYYYSDTDGFGGIEYLPEGTGGAINYGDYKHMQSSFGPFKTFGEAKRHCLEGLWADIEIARGRIREVKQWKKEISFYKGKPKLT